MSKTHWKKLTDPNYLGSWDFQKGEERVLVIKNVTREEVFNPNSGKKEMCTVAHFYENHKPMILNKTNCKMIERLHKTPHIEDWQNASILVGVDRIKARGELVDALRIRNKLPNPQNPPSEKHLYCADCNNEILDYGKYSADKIASSTLKTYGALLCYSCGKKRETRESEADND